MAGTGSFWRSAGRWARWLARVPAPGAGDGEPDEAGSASGVAGMASGTAGPSGRGGHVGVVGGYRIERTLGHGASGAVHVAVDPVTEARVAIKTIPLAGDGVDAAEARRRFLREAQAAGRLRHPDIVTVHAAGEERGIGFIVMELVSGHDLSRYTRPALLLPEPVVLHIVARVAEALAYAHSQGVVHRDVKPANVMVHLPSHGVKVTDFGVAHVGDATGTRSGMSLGTPVYMSPEQLAGARVDGRSDLYSLGVMLFQLLTGRLPYEGDSMGELLRRVATRPPLALHALRPDLPQALSEALALALDKRPEARYADGHRMAEDLHLIEARLEPSPGVGQSVTPVPAVRP